MLVKLPDLLVIHRVGVTEHALYLLCENEVCRSFTCVRSLEFGVNGDSRMVCVIDGSYDSSFFINDPEFAKQILDFYCSTMFTGVVMVH